MFLSSFAEGLGLPPDVVAMVENSPVEDICLSVLRHYIPSIESTSLIPESPPERAPLILVRKDAAFGEWGGDPRFIDEARIRIDVFAQDPNGDEKGAVVSEAVRIAFRNAAMENHHIPGRGWLRRADMIAEPSRKTDWATSSGPVQYADLPTGYWRYESKFDLLIRRQR